MAGALLGYGALTGSARHREAALAALGVLGPIAPQYPRAAGAGLAVAEAVVSGPAEIAVVGPPGDPRTAALHTTAMLAAPPGAVIALGGGVASGRGAAAPERPGRSPRRPFRCWRAGPWWPAPRPPTFAAISPAACRSLIPWNSGPSWTTRLRRHLGRGTGGRV